MSNSNDNNIALALKKHLEKYSWDKTLFLSPCAEVNSVAKEIYNGHDPNGKS